MTAFYGVSEFYPKSVLLQFGTSRARLGKRLTHSAQKCREQISYISQKNQNLEPGFQIFQIPDPIKSVLGPVDVFCRFLYVQKIIDLFTVFKISYKFALILFISFSYEPSRQYGTSPFSKTLLKNRNDCKRGIGQIRIFFN